MLKNLFWSFFSSITLSQISYAQNIINQQLRTPIINAIETNYGIKNKFLEIEKNKFQMEEIKGKLKPDVSALALGSFFYSNGTIDIPTKSLDHLGIILFEENQNFNTSMFIGSIGVNAKQVIFSGLQIPNAIKAIEEKNVAFDYLAESEKESIAKDVIQTFDQIMLLDKIQELINSSSKRLNKEHLKVQKAIQNGLAIPYDREKIKLALLELETKQIELNGTKKLLYDKLTTLTHLPTDNLEIIHYNLSPIDLFSNEYSLENKQEIKALEHSIKAYEFLYKKEKGAHLPQVFAFANSNYSSIFGQRMNLRNVGENNKDVNLKVNQLTFFPNILVGVGAKWEIFDGGQHKNKLYQVKSDIKINENKLEDTKEKLNLLLNKNKIDYETSNEKLKVNEQQNTVATNNLDIASKRFEQGLIDVTERLSAENDYYKANLGYYSQILDQRSKTYEILHTSGELLNKILN
ncbi:TolC family protein [Empedobacter falsenii]|uniref:Type I secretion outer membrane protein, TolC family n=1 Tax=Empedobacter falsenii TaxID=343874 RepID=A0A376GEB9_9FLAO|nr:TolC family protein [Empedobacter falsenii]STD59159.1 type I secretion outer membrane protein, TolC family [Empedobacter falsenii]